MTPPAAPAGAARAPRPLAVVTGASRGLGRVLAGFLAAGGFDLVLTARGARALQQAAEELPGEGRYRTLAGSVTDRDHVAAVARAAGRRLDLLVHNASTLGPNPLPPLAQAQPEALRDALETNVVAPLVLTQALMPALTRAHGLVVAITSDAAVGDYPGWGVYGASKAALELLARTLAAELETIDVVVVDPGDMRTDMHQRAFPTEDISDLPAPEVTLPFFAWLLSQPRESVNGRRFEAQSDAWTVAGPAG